MGVHKYRAQWPVIHEDPNFWFTMKNFNWKDYSIWGALTLGGIPVGYFGALKAASIARVPLAQAGAYIGFTGGWCVAMIRSGERLMGRAPNDGEVAHYKWRLDFKRYQVRVEPKRFIIQDELDEIIDAPKY